MEYIKADKRVQASDDDWNHLRRIASLKPQTKIPNLGRWRREDDDFLWRGIVWQICNRGGTRSYDSLKKKGLMDAFNASLSLEKLIEVRSEKKLWAWVEEQMHVFHVGRFQDDNIASVVANFRTLSDKTGHLTELRRRLDDLDRTKGQIGPSVQQQEREARRFLMERLIFYHNGVQRHAKRKPPSDFLIDIGFARTLIPFDSRQKKIFKVVFGLTVTDDNYEAIENWFLKEAYPELHITPSEFDRIVFQHNEELSKPLRRSATARL